MLCEGEGLPQGSYLSHLQRLSLVNWNYEAGIPPALRGAARLTYLNLTPPNDLNDDVVAALVTSLPAALKELIINYDDSIVPAEKWNQRISHLRASLIAEGRSTPVLERNGRVVP